MKFDHICRMKLLLTALITCVLYLPATNSWGKDGTVIQVDTLKAVSEKNRVPPTKPLDIGHLKYAHGVQVTGNSELVYAIPEGFKRFEAWVGRDMTTPKARLRFRVFTDDTLAFDSGWCVYRGSSQNPNVNAQRAMRVSVPLAGCKQLRLVTEGVGNADWAEAVLVQEGYPLWQTPPPSPEDALAPTPPMGWNAWNSLGSKITAESYKQIVDTVVSIGMKDAGYLYITLDDLHGKEKKTFPKGLKASADYAHSKGLKFGMYGQGELRLNQGVPNAAKLAAIGVDFFKYDYSTKRQNIQLIEDIKKTGRPIVVSTCEWGLDKPWEWAPGIGSQMWRESFDLLDRWEAKWAMNASNSEIHHNRGIGIINSIDLMEAMGRYTRPGQWNDPDCLVVGLHGKSQTSGHIANSGCTCEEYRTQFSLYCMLATPLFASNDLRDMDEFCRETLVNKEAIAVNQDPLGVPGWRCRKLDEKEVWIKPLKGGDLAVALFNRGKEATKIEVRWIDLDIAGKYKVRDLWAHSDLGKFNSKLDLDVKSHEVRLLRLSPAK